MRSACRRVPRRGAAPTFGSAGFTFGLVLLGAALAGAAQAATPAKLRLGVLLAASGPQAQAARSIENGFRLALSESGGRLAGREIEWLRAGDSQDADRAAEAARRLIADRADVLLGVGPAGVAEAVLRVTRESGVPHLVPDSGLAAITGALCASNVIRTSASYWQSGFATGVEMGRRGGLRSVATVAWRHPAGEEFVKGFRDGFLRAAGRTVQEFWAPASSTDFQATLAGIAAFRPGATFAAFPGAAATRFVLEYERAGLRKTAPLTGPGLLTEEAGARVLDGVDTVLHYGDDLQAPRNKAFALAYAKVHQQAPDAAAVAGYDSAVLLAAGLRAAEGDAARRATLIAAMRKAVVDSPRGRWTLSRNHNPVQDHYLRRTSGGANRVIGMAARQVGDDPDAAAACAMQPL